MFVATSEFSLGQSLLSVDDIVKTVTDNELESVIVADTMNVSSMIPLSEKLGGKLITGVRLTLVEQAEQARLPTYQLKVYPKNEAGMKLIYKYLSRSFERPYFYMEPRLDIGSFVQLCGEAGKDIVVSTGDFNNIFNYAKHEWLYHRTSGMFGTPWIVDVCPVKTARWDKLNYLALRFAEKFDLKAHWYVPAIYDSKDAELFPVHYSIHKNVEFNFLSPYTESYHYHKDISDMVNETCERIHARYGDLPTATPIYTLDPLDFYKWSKNKPLLPSLSRNPEETLKRLAIDGFKQRLRDNLYGYKPEDKELRTTYVDRLKYELKTLTDLGFSDYFLLVYELIHWCKKQDIKVGPGRGSVGGSLVAFCLGITDVDPVRFGLLFERFINPTRLDLPDIDLDFQTSRRGEIIEHLYDRYGQENVAGIINYASLQASSALRSTCRILGLEPDEYSCSKLVPKNFGFSLSLEESAEKVIEIKNFSKTHPTYWDKAVRLEKKLRNFSTHAAGVIVSSRPLINDAVVEIRGKDNTRIINWDKKICEKQGLIKLDILGLTTLDIMDLCVQYINSIHGVDIDLGAIPLDDKKTLAQFAEGNTGGVFQFEGGSVKKLLKGLAKGGEITFDDLVAANALNRPGPIEAGLVDDYIDGKNGNLHDAFHPSIAHIVEPTFNVICYQEQIMAVSVAFAGYSLPEADNLRKIMGKKLPEEMKKEANKFIEGAEKTNGIPRSVSGALFEQISKFAFYAFNKSHSVEYSLLSYLCMWLKTYYPAEFYAASLTYVDDKKVRSIITEAKKNGISVEPPHINYSTDKFIPTSATTIVAPLSKIKYVQGAAKEIMRVREEGGPFSSVEDLQERTTKRLVNSRVVGALKAVGAMDSIDPDSASMDPVERSKAINEYLPSIPLGYVRVDREIELNKSGKTGLGTLLINLKKDDNRLVMPYLGSTPKFMAVFDNATATEGKNGKFTESKGFNAVQLALYKNDLNKADGYWTGLVKRTKAKGEKIFDNSTLDASFKILKQEIELIRPPVIVCLGSNINRMFVPTLKGGPTETALQVHYDPALDANIVLGFSPGMIHFNPDLEDTLIELFDLVAGMVN